MEEGIQFYKRDCWWPVTDSFVEEWEAYGLNEQDYWQAKEGHPEYKEYHWFFQEPKSKQVFRKVHVRTIKEIKSCVLPEAIIIHELTGEFTQEIQKYYEYHNTRSNI